MSAPAGLIGAHGQLTAWLRDTAFPLWAERGPDRVLGGWHDRLDQSGEPAAGPQRARVQARQVWTFAQAPRFGWAGDWRGPVRWGLEALDHRFRRPDGLYRGLAPPADPGAADAAELYDQAFVLLALSAAREAGEAGAELAAEHLLGRLAPHPLGGFREVDGGAALLANPNMHLFEAFLAWAAVGGGTVWQALADRQAELARTRLIDLHTGALGEDFGPDWTAPADPARQRVEPGHLFEWAWLLLQWSRTAGRAQDLQRALHLIALAEQAGCDHHRGVAVDLLDGDLNAVALTARLWPQTERLKANLAAAEITGSAACWAAAETAAAAILRYLDVPRPGLWRDRLDADGRFVDEPAPASSFYHLVLAIRVLDEVVASAD
ncbi:AGE family epimerase/isomerase [Caulobacter sp. KR2-114]|uniref:AGE family epimerase/isomerase n=1 Tax=Caulobacter sp. KR2-114 TaxID=3400912 RepID=UPI003C037E69